MLQVFERQVLQFRFQFVESKLVSEGGIDVRRLDREATARFGIGIIFDKTHQHHTAGNEQQHHAHIRRLRNEQVAEIVRFEHLLIHRLEFVHTFEGR